MRPDAISTSRCDFVELWFKETLLQSSEMFSSLEVANSFRILILPLDENISSMDTRDAFVESLVIVKTPYFSSSSSR